MCFNSDSNSEGTSCQCSCFPLSHTDLPWQTNVLHRACMMILHWAPFLPYVQTSTGPCASGSKLKSYCEGFWMAQVTPHVTAEPVRRHRGRGDHFSSQLILQLPDSTESFVQGQLLDSLESFARQEGWQLLSTALTQIPMHWVTFSRET